MNIFTKYTKLIITISMIVFFAGCEDEVEELPQVTAGFTYTVNEDTGTVTFINTSTNATKFLWEFGDGETSTEINPVKTYPTGTYTVNLTASHVAGASDTFEDMIAINIKIAVSLPITFDNNSVNYNPTTFNGASFAIVDNPDQSGTNNKVTKVGALTNSGVAFEGMFFDLGSDIDLATDKRISMNLWADEAVSVLLKLEEGTAGAIEVTSNHGGTGWETVNFDFNSTAKYSRLTMFVDGPGTTAGTFYLDDIEQKEAEIPCTAEAAQSLTASDFNLTFQTDPGTAIGSFDAVYTFATNPDFENDVNSSCNVGKIERSGGALFANNQIEFNSKLDFTTHSGFKLKVYSSTAGYNVLVKLEDKANPAINTEVSRTTTVGANAWEELTFPFAGSESGKYDKIILFFQLNTNTTATYYIDDFAYYGSGSGATSPTTAAPTPPARDANDVISIFSNAYTNITGIDYNPNWGQATVTTTIDIAGNATLKYAGLNYQGTDFSGNAQDVAAMEFLHIDYWTANSTALNASIISTGPSEKAKALTVPTNGNWTSIDIPLSEFTPPVNLANIIQLKFDGNGDIFLDNIYFYKTSGGGGTPGTNLATNGDFETGDATGWALFQNGGTAALDNTINNGGSWSGKLATGGPSNPAFKQERIGAGTVQAGDVVRISFDHKGAIVQPGAVFNVLLFGEGAGGASFTHVFNPAPIPGANWTTFTGTFTIAPGTDVSEGISFLIEAVCGGDAGCSVTANIDNVSVVLNP
jgi:hypothetical protein